MIDQRSPPPHLALHNSKKMNTTPDRHNLQRGQIGDERKGKERGKTALSVLKLIKRKVAAVFSILASRKGKAASGSSSGLDHAKGASFSTDTTSSQYTNKTSSKYVSFDSYASSGAACAGLIGTANFSMEEIFKATEKFSPNNIIGEGGFGTVYKGRLKDGSLVAVKRAKKNIQDKRISEFKNEILTLSQIEHLNLVRLYGYLEHGDEQIIVVEYVGNGTLREHLDGQRGDGFEIAERLDIAIDIAHAVTYLHTYTDTPIIHRDIKASNILITEKLRAKVADFGFARASEDPSATHISTQVKGTAGYLDPEYLRTYQLTDKSDVYSFGVLLVEMMTARYPIEPKRPLHERVTIRWAMQKLKGGEAVLAMDPRMRRTPASIKAMEGILKLAFLCLAPSRQSRPSMQRSAEILWGIRKEFREETNISHSPLIQHHSADFHEKDARNPHNRQYEIGDDATYKFNSA